MARLKLCPFCGSVAKLLERDNVNPQGGKQYAVRCTNSNCIYRPDVWRVNRADVVSMWNRRADRKTEPQTEVVNEFYANGELIATEVVEAEPQTETSTNSEKLQLTDDPQVVMPKECKGCDSASKIIEAYSRGFEDGAEAVKALKVKALHKDYVEPYVKIEDEPQTEDEILREQCRAFMGIVEQTERSSE